MPGKITAILIVFFWLLLGSVLSVSAQTATPANEPTCDLCGWCNKAAYPTPPPNWNACISCLYNPDGTPKDHAYYTVLGCLSTDPTGTPFVKTMMSFVFGIAGGVAFLAFLSGSAVVLTSAGDPEKLKNGKDIITSSILGLLLILFSAFLLRFVGYDVLRIPGFG